MHRRDSRWSATRRQVTWRSATQQKHDGSDEAVGKRNENTTKATGAVAKTSELSSSGMEIEIAELLFNSVSEEEKEQEVAMSVIMLSRDVRPWCGINSIAEFSDNNNHDDNDDNSLELESPLTHLVSKIEVKKRVISNESEFVKVTKKPKKLDFSNIVSSKGKSLEIFADESEGNDGLKMKKTRVSFHPS
ncbi:hypothetical protein P8452_49670 [Trifolium repens]|nr:hypothetical protein P8452_49670 [Trifolium repens]